MKEKVIARLKQIEANLAVYNKYVNVPTQAKENREVVSFKLLFEMMAFNAYLELVPEYQPSVETLVAMASNLGAVSNYVSVVDGEVVISPEYQKVLAQRDQFIKPKG